MNCSVKDCKNTVPILSCTNRCIEHGGVNKCMNGTSMICICSFIRPECLKRFSKKKSEYK